jgi:hypothetical protein
MSASGRPVTVWRLVRAKRPVGVFDEPILEREPDHAPAPLAEWRRYKSALGKSLHHPSRLFLRVDPAPIDPIGLKPDSMAFAENLHHWQVPVATNRQNSGRAAGRTILQKSHGFDWETRLPQRPLKH